MSLTAFFAKIKAANRARLHKRRTVAKFLANEAALNASYTNSPIAISVVPSKYRDFYFRPTSLGDKGVIKQMFFDREYDLRQWEQGRSMLKLARHYADKGIESLIVDAGANIGAAAVFFHEALPNVKLVCVEPNPGNCAVCRNNIAGTSAVLLESAISSSVGEVTLFDPGLGDWGFRTGVPDSATAGLVVPTISVDKILELYASGREPLVAKIDIEGAEADLFSKNCGWMDVFPCIIIELHDWMLPRERSSSNFLKQVASRNFDFLHRGENIFLFNMKLIDEKLAS